MRWLIGVMVLIWPTILLAAFDVGAAAPKTVPFKTFEDVVSRLFDFGITIGGIIFLILFLVGGIMYLVSAGNEDQTGKAKRLMVDAIIGLVLVLGAWAIANFVFKQLTLGTPIGSGGIGSGGSPTSTTNTPGRLPTTTPTIPASTATPVELTTTPSGNQSSGKLPKEVSARFLVAKTSTNGSVEDNSVTIAIDELGGDNQSKTIQSGQPIGGAVVLNFVPKTDKTYYVKVTNSQGKILTNHHPAASRGVCRGALALRK